VCKHFALLLRLPCTRVTFSSYLPQLNKTGDASLYSGRQNYDR